MYWHQGKAKRVLNYGPTTSSPFLSCSCRWNTIFKQLSFAQGQDAMPIYPWMASFSSLLALKWFKQVDQILLWEREFSPCFRLHHSPCLFILFSIFSYVPVWHTVFSYTLWIYVTHMYVVVSSVWCWESFPCQLKNWNMAWNFPYSWCKYKARYVQMTISALILITITWKQLMSIIR